MGTGMDGEAILKLESSCSLEEINHMPRTPIGGNIRLQRFSAVSWP